MVTVQKVSGIFRKSGIKKGNNGPFVTKTVEGAISVSGAPERMLRCAAALKAMGIRHDRQTGSITIHAYEVAE